MSGSAGAAVAGPGRVVVLLCALLASVPAPAFELGVGLEGGGTLSLAQKLTGSAQSSASGGVGLIFEERFKLARIELTLWEDVQTPYTLNVATPELAGGLCLSCEPELFLVAASYVPVDAGLRLGWAFSRLHPYLGIFLNDSILSSNTVFTASASGSSTGQRAPYVFTGDNSDFVGLGGDIGLDVTVLFLRFGLELRAFWSVTGVSETNLLGASAGSAVVLQALLSAHAAF